MNQKTKPKSDGTLFKLVVLICFAFTMLYQYYINQRLEIAIENQGEIISLIATGNRTNMSNLDMNFRTSAIIENLFGNMPKDKDKKK